MLDVVSDAFLAEYKFGTALQLDDAPGRAEVLGVGVNSHI